MLGLAWGFIARSELPQYLSGTVYATIAVRTVRISPAHSGAAPWAMNGRTLLILRVTEGSRFPCILRLPKESRSVPSARAVRCGGPEERVSSSASGSVWRSFGPIAATTATPASGASSAAIRLPIAPWSTYLSFVRSRPCPTLIRRGTRSAMPHPPAHAQSLRQKSTPSASRSNRKKSLRSMPG
jgi:hypothetical protein